MDKEVKYSDRCKNFSGQPGRALSDEAATYEVGGRRFIVQPVFSQTAGDTIGSVLVRLMRADAGNN